MKYYNIILIVLTGMIITCCSKEKLDSSGRTGKFYDEYINVSMMDTLAKADSLIITLYDEYNIETTRIRFDINHNRIPGTIVYGTSSYLSFGFDTLILDYNAKLSFLEGENVDSHAFNLEIAGLGISMYDATISISENHNFFYGANGLADVNQFYHYQVGPIKSFNLLVFN